jgi:hypothetical protein
MIPKVLLPHLNRMYKPVVKKIVQFLQDLKSGLKQDICLVLYLPESFLPVISDFFTIIVSVERDSLQLRHKLPDPCPGMNRHIGIIGDLINFRNCFGSAQSHGLGIICKQRPGLICHAPDISGY